MQLLLSDVKQRKENFTIDLPTNSKVGSFVHETNICKKKKKKNNDRNREK